MQPGQISSRSSKRKMWEAVQNRDRTADGEFVYAVRSTGIYCRPSCPSRKPKRAQVIFFPLPQAAEGNGFRACLRCRPRFARIHDPRVDAVARVCREIERRVKIGEEAGGRLSLAALGTIGGMKAHQLERAFRRLVGISPKKYADTQRMARLKSRLKEGDNVTTALYDAGFGSSSRLYERAPAQLGMTPARYRQGGAGMRIDYTIVDSPLGRLLVAATTRGISALYLGESDDNLEAALRKEYPGAELSREGGGPENLRGWTETILEHLRGREPHLDLPTDVRGTAFQRRVWEELRRIPYGATRTYTDIARKIGKPSAVRAVARACATNPVSVVVPCHRVVRQSGELAGYRWGLERKNALLEMETAQATKSRSKT